jgi:hypothetical protein
MVEHKPGDFRLMKITGHAGRAIRIGQWLNGDGYGDYQHAQVYLGDNRFLDAQPGGANVGYYDNLNTVGYWSSGLVDMTDDQRDKIHIAAIGYIGTPYAFTDYFALGAHRLHIPAPHLDRYIRSSGHMICSQLVDQCCLDGGVHLFNDGRWSGDVTPGDLWKLLEGKAYAAST